MPYPKGKPAWNKGKTMSDETKHKISEGVSKAQQGRTLTEEHRQNIAKGVKKKNLEKGITKENDEKQVESILDLSTRTVTKILIRGNFGCSRCGWNESTCDIHHINGRKIENANHHNNLSLLCPNCHRLVHTNKIKKEELISIAKQIGDKWKQYYYWNE